MSDPVHPRHAISSPDDAGDFERTDFLKQEDVDEFSKITISSGLITTTITVSPHWPGAEPQFFSATALSRPRLDDDEIRALIDEAGLEIVRELQTPTDLVAGVAALIGTNPRRPGRKKSTPVESARLDIANFMRSWRNRPPDDNIKLISEYITFGETVLVEESPPRRTSPAAIAATKVASRMLTAGGGGTSITAVLVHGDVSFYIIVAGSAVTLVMSTASAGLVLATHWLGKRLKV